MIGQRLAHYEILSNLGKGGWDGTANIWIYNILNGTLDQLTFDGGERPLRTPDGEQITYRNDGSLWNIRSDFTGDRNELIGTDIGQTAIDVRTDPRLIRGNPVDLFGTEGLRVSVSGSVPGEGMPMYDVSADGERFLFSDQRRESVEGRRKRGGRFPPRQRHPQLDPRTARSRAGGLKRGGCGCDS